MRRVLCVLVALVIFLTAPAWIVAAAAGMIVYELSWVLGQMFLGCYKWADKGLAWLTRGRR